MNNRFKHQNFIGGIVNNQKFNTDHPYDVFITPFYWVGGLVRVNKVEINVFYNYDVQVPIPLNTESGEPELQKIGDK